MKKILAVFLICIIVLTGCVDESSAESSSRRRSRQSEKTADATGSAASTTEEVGLNYYPYFGMQGESIPDEVFTTTAEENGLAGTMFMIIGEVEGFDTFEGSNYSYMWVDTITNGKVIVLDSVQGLCEQADASGWDLDKEKFRSLLPLPEVGEFAVIFAEYDGWSEKLECPMFVYGGEDYLVESLLASMSNETTEQLDPESNYSEPTPKQKEALDRAATYLQVLPFSYKGLISQLEYEGYSTADATYAADNCGADWNQQAVLKAERYMELMSFTRDGLIGQLEYEGFTHDQAVHGADSVGL